MLLFTRPRQSTYRCLPSWRLVNKVTGLSLLITGAFLRYPQHFYLYIYRLHKKFTSDGARVGVPIGHPCARLTLRYSRLGNSQI